MLCLERLTDQHHFLGPIALNSRPSACNRETKFADQIYFATMTSSIMQQIHQTFYPIIVTKQNKNFKGKRASENTSVKSLLGEFHKIIQVY